MKNKLILVLLGIIVLSGCGEPIPTRKLSVEECVKEVIPPNLENFCNALVVTHAKYVQGWIDQCRKQNSTRVTRAEKGTKKLTVEERLALGLNPHGLVDSGCTGRFESITLHQCVTMMTRGGMNLLGEWNDLPEEK